MSKERFLDEKKKAPKPVVTRKPEKHHDGGGEAETSSMVNLQQMVGNRAVVQRLLAQRSGDGAVALDDDVAARIDQARSDGHPLDSEVQDQMGAALEHDFEGVRVHTSPESDALNRQLGARAFATGQDVFFRQDAYDPHSMDGKELIAHELTHVVQQGAGPSSSVGRMKVNPPGDAYEQEADAVAKMAVQRQPEEEEEEELQMQAEEEEEELQMQAEEEEEELQMQEEEEELQMQEEEEDLQLHAEEEEEELQMQAEEEEEELQMQAEEEEEELQMQAEEEEEELQMQEEEEELQMQAEGEEEKEEVL
jgi:hypothetical protein